MPASWQSYYATFPAGFDQADGPLPTACTSAPADDCDYDLVCTAGSCSARAPAQTGACVGADFTVGMPCWNGTHFTFTVCNRGTVPGASGILPIGHYTGAPTADPATCAFAITNPQGECDIDLSATPLAPGQCIPIVPTTDPRCTGVTDDTGDQFYWVDFAGTSTVPAIAECDTCNNLTETNESAETAPGAACVDVSCGTHCCHGDNGTGNSGCNQGIGDWEPDGGDGCKDDNGGT